MQDMVGRGPFCQFPPFPRGHPATTIRSRGTGWAAGMTKAGGILILAVAVSAKTVPSIPFTAVIGIVPLLLAALCFLFIGPETRQRPLEEISRLEAEPEAA